MQTFNSLFVSLDSMLDFHLNSEWDSSGVSWILRGQITTDVFIHYKHHTINQLLKLQIINTLLESYVYNIALIIKYTLIIILRTFNEPVCCALDSISCSIVYILNRASSGASWTFQSRITTDEFTFVSTSLKSKNGFLNEHNSISCNRTLISVLRSRKTIFGTLNNVDYSR